MKGFFATHNKALKAEWLKLHHSGMIWLCLGAALFVPLISTLIGFFGTMGSPNPERWNQMIELNFKIFTAFFFPLFVVIMVVRVIYLEHRSDTWKLIETQPVSKAAIFFSKWEIAAFISFSCLTAMLLFSLLSGLILQYGRPSLGFDQGGVDWGKTSQALLRYWIASLGIISIQYFFSLLIKSFAWPMSIGLIGIIGGAIVAELGYMNWWPYSATQFTSGGYDGPLNGQFLLSHEKISLVASVLLIWLSYQLYRRKSFKKAFVSPLKNLGLAIGVITVFILIIWTVNKPITFNKHTATVLAGKIDSETPVNQVLLLSSPLMDTVLSIPVENNKFHLRTDQNIPTGMYVLKAGTQTLQVFMGNKDSVFVDLEFKDQGNDIEISGTRTAENDFLRNGQGMNVEYIKQYANNRPPDEFIRMVIEPYEEGVHKLETYKTNDRIKPADDFIQMMKKIYTMRLLAMVDGFYPAVHASYFPNEELKFPRVIDRLRKVAPMNSPELVSFSEYRAFVSTTMKEKAGMSDSLYYTMMRDSLQDPYTRDILLYEVASESLLKMKDSAARNMMVASLLSNMQTPSVKAKLTDAISRANSLMGGKPAFNFTATSLNNKEMGLANFAGKYLVVGFTRSGCDPCKKETPYFEAHADRYTSREVTFALISLDTDTSAWKSESVKKKESKVLQLIAKGDAAALTQAYGLGDLPRWVLIDPSGNIINANLPGASDPRFETSLQNQISYLSRLR